jgi:colicin import membrane protein
MATTEQRSGFRLPWTAEPRSNAEQAEADASPVDDTAQAVLIEETDPEVAADGSADATETVAASPYTIEAVAGTDVADEQSAEETAGQTDEQTGEPADEPAGQTSTETAEQAAVVSASTENQTVSSDTATTSAPAAAMRRPSKFMADLTVAMQAAAESARAGTLTQFQADAKACVEDIHARSAGQASELRKRADDDVAGIREWSKAELARVREQTERKITARKSELEGQLEYHAGVIEHEIERVHNQVGTFEAQMAVFFEGLSAEQDPTRIAALAENLPEPPPFEPVSIELDDIVTDSGVATGLDAVGKGDDDAMAGLASDDNEPETTDTTDTTGQVEATASDVVGETTDATDTTDTTRQVEAIASDVVGETTDATDATEQVEAELGPQTDEEREQAMASIQASFEAAAQAEADAARAEAEAAEAAVATDAEQPADPDAADGHPASAEAETVGDADPDDMLIGDTDPDGPVADSRLAALGLSDFGAAEAAAAAAAAGATNDDEILTIDDDALAARLNGLVPDRAPSSSSAPAAKDEATETTQVVVVGLVSVASIASFKRHLGRIQGVRSVGVSSGPDGEFVFSTTHSTDISIKDVISSIPGFRARVTSAGDGVVNVATHDPESEG